jgi:hypothetical protein
MFRSLTRDVLGFVLCGMLSVFFPATATAKDLCFSTTDGLDIVLKNFHVKKGQTFPVSGWTVHFFPPSALDYQPVSGQAIATKDGKHVAMGLTVVGAVIVNLPGVLQETTGFSGGVFHTVILDQDAGNFAGFDGRLRMDVNGNHDETPGNNKVIVFDCSDLGSLALP